MVMAAVVAEDRAPSGRPMSRRGLRVLHDNGKRRVEIADRGYHGAATPALPQGDLREAVREATDKRVASHRPALRPLIEQADHDTAAVDDWESGSYERPRQPAIAEVREAVVEAARDLAGEG